MADLTNALLLERAVALGTNNYQQLTAAANVNNYESNMAALTNPYNVNVWNGVTGLHLEIGNTIVEGKQFEDPLRVIKKPSEDMPNGEFERHVGVHYLREHGYRVDSETLLKYEAPEYTEYLQAITRQARYEFSFARYEVMRSFRGADSYGFRDLESATVSQMISSDQVAEMEQTLAQLALADSKLGLYRHNIEGAINTREGATELLAQIRVYAERMTFPSTLFNLSDIPVFENPETLILLVSAEAGVKAYLDVLALATLFNIDRANINMRVISVPSLGIDGAYAALMSEDFLYIRDVLYGIFVDPLRADTLTDKFYLHHWSRIGVNRFANCVLFGNFESGTSVIPTVTQTVTGLQFAPATYEAERGGSVDLKLELVGTVTGSDGSTTVRPDAALFNVTAMRGSTPVQLNQRTQVDRNGTLHVQKTGLEVGDVLTVTAVSAYLDPTAASTDTYTATATVTIVADDGAIPVDEKPFIEYTGESEDAQA